MDKLVLDMRWNNGGDTGLVPTVLESLIRDVKVAQPGKLFVIVGHRTFSAAQNAVAMIARFTPAVFVGDTTGSSPNFIGDTFSTPDVAPTAARQGPRRSPGA